MHLPFWKERREGPWASLMTPEPALKSMSRPCAHPCSLWACVVFSNANQWCMGLWSIQLNSWRHVSGSATCRHAKTALRCCSCIGFCSWFVNCALRILIWASSSASRPLLLVLAIGWLKSVNSTRFQPNWLAVWATSCSTLTTSTQPQVNWTCWLLV